MDDIKALVGLISDLPQFALWVIAAILVYKVAIVGSIYGVLRLAIEKLHNVLVTRKAREVEYKEIRPMLDGLCISAETDRLIGQIHRLRGKGVPIPSEYIHSNSVDWLREAIDAKIEADRVKAGAK